MNDAAKLWQVEPIEIGRRRAESSMFLLHTEPGTLITLAYRFWLLHRGAETMLVDCGFGAAEARRRGIEAVTEPVAALAERGIAPSDVGRVVLTHLHWDHAGTADLFHRAELVVQRAEIEFFRDPLSRHPAIGRFFERTDLIEALLASDRLRVLDGDTLLEPGLEVLHIGGHTPGLQVVVVETGSGRAVIASDAVPLNRNLLDDIPCGIFTDLGAVVAGLARLRALGAHVLYPGHDPTPILSMERCPANANEPREETI